MRQKTLLLQFLCALITTFIAVGCSKPEYVAQVNSQSVQTPADGRLLPAQVDLVIVPDNSGSITSSVDVIKNQISDFANALQKKYWDYHIAISVLNNPPSIDKVLVNSNFNNSILPDGSANPSTALVPQQYTYTDTSQFLDDFSGIDINSDSQDETYLNTYVNLFNVIYDPQAFQKNLLRPNALLAIIIITNGAEFSVDPFHTGDFDPNGNLKTWADQFLALKTSPQLLRFYPIVANSWHPLGTCEGGSSLIGTSYTDILNFVNGMSFDFCDPNALKNVMNDISNDLQVVRQKYLYSYIVLNSVPNPTTIKITKQDGTVIPQGSQNGWTYLPGSPQTVDTVTAYITNSDTCKVFDPNVCQTVSFHAFSQTGWVIQLHGSAQLIGNEQVNVTYAKP